MTGIGENVGETSSLNIFEFILPLLGANFWQAHSYKYVKTDKKNYCAISTLEELPCICTCKKLP